MLYIKEKFTSTFLDHEQLWIHQEKVTIFLQYIHPCTYMPRYFLKQTCTFFNRKMVCPFQSIGIWKNPEGVSKLTQGVLFMQSVPFSEKSICTEPHVRMLSNGYPYSIYWDYSIIRNDLLCRMCQIFS